MCGMVDGTKIVVKHDGTVLPCEAFKEHKLTDRVSLGSIYEDTMETCMERYNTNTVINIFRWFYDKPIPDPDFNIEKAIAENQDVARALAKSQTLNHVGCKSCSKKEEGVN